MANFKRGQIQILRGGQPHIKYRESQLPRGGESIPRGGKHPSPPLPPEINPGSGLGRKLQRVSMALNSLFYSVFIIPARITVIPEKIIITGAGIMFPMFEGSMFLILCMRLPLMCLCRKSSHTVSKQTARR